MTGMDKETTRDQDLNRLRREAARTNTEFRPATRQQLRDAKRLYRGFAAMGEGLDDGQDFGE
jgi:hypothetical protein